MCRELVRSQKFASEDGHSGPSGFRRTTRWAKVWTGQSAHPPIARPQCFSSSVQVRLAVRRFLLGVWLLLIGCNGDRRAADSNPPEKPAPQREPRQQTKRPAGTQPEQTPSASQPTPQPVYRPDDLRQQHDDARLAEAGIRVYESERLKLYTDIDAEIARTLPPLIDAVYLAWVEYFGELPAARDGSTFQLTGYLIRDESLFREAGLVPENLPMFEHGRHRRHEFWLREQKFDYFRRHLLLHEATHCFMTILSGVTPPVWYIEGMAEYFATHQIQQDGAVRFRVMPTSPNEFAGWGRITAIRNEFADKQSRSISEIIAWEPTDFLKPVPYAWSWGLCQFLDAHPRYREPFRKLGSLDQGHAFRREFTALFQQFERELNTEWQLFSQNLQYGYEATRAAIDFRSGTLLVREQPARRCDIAAGRGWQSSGVRMEAGQTYKIASVGRFTLAELPKPWISEPQGITFRYFDGRPLGQLLGCLDHEPESLPRDAASMQKVFEIGRGLTFVAPHTGTLYLRLNDTWSSLTDNHGDVAVTVEQH